MIYISLFINFRDCFYSIFISMKITKIILFSFLLVLAILQFFRIKKNENNSEQVNHISNQFSAPDEVGNILKKSCYDCHSNNTAYPWYANIQPVAWWLQNHINEGKEELNFDEFALYKPRRQFKKMEEMQELISENEMPLYSYTLLHGNAKLSEEEKTILITWSKEIRYIIKTKNPGSVPAEDEDD